MTTVKTLPAFRSATTASNGGVSTLNINTPASMASTDFLVLSVVVRDDRTVTTPSGWTETIFYSALPNPGFNFYVFTRVAGSQTSPLTISVTGGTTTISASMCAYTGVSYAYPTEGVDGWGGPDGSGYTTAPLSLTASEASAVGELPTKILYFGASRAEITVTWTPPTGFTERVDTSYTSSTLRFSHTVADATYAGHAPPWTGTPSGVHPKDGSAYLFLVGTTSFVADTQDFPANPNEPFGFDVPFADGIHTVYAGWSGALLLIEANLGGSAFRLDDATFGLLNMGRLGPSTDGWVDLGCHLEDLEMTVGATQDDGVLTRFEAGTARLTLNNEDQRFDPLNPDGPYYQDWRIGTKIRVAGQDRQIFLDNHDPDVDNVLDGMWGMFIGRIDGFGAQGFANDRPTVTVDLVDDVALFAAYDAAEQPAVGAGDDIEERVQRILDELGWDGTMVTDATHPEWPTATFQSTTLAQPAWTEMLLSCDAVNVGPIIRGDGVLYLQPLSPDTDTYLLQKFGCADEGEVPVIDVEVAFDQAQLRNIVDAARIGGTVQRFADTTSIARYGRHAWNRVDLPLQNDADVTNFGQYVLNHSAEVAPRVTGIRIAPQLAGNELYHGVDQYILGNFTASLLYSVWYTLCRLTLLRYSAIDPAQVRFTHPGTGREMTQMVVVRGIDVAITPDFWEFGFVTSNIDSWFDIFTLAAPSASLADAEQSRLSRGHRLAAA